MGRIQVNNIYGYWYYLDSRKPFQKREAFFVFKSMSRAPKQAERAQRREPSLMNLVIKSRLNEFHPVTFKPAIAM